MELIDWIVIGVIACIVGGAVAYIVKAKKSGRKCIGCPDSANCSARACSGACASCTGCGTTAQTQDGEEQDETES